MTERNIYAAACWGIVAGGGRCARRTGHVSGLCWQHQQRPVTPGDSHRANPDARRCSMWADDPEYQCRARTADPSGRCRRHRT